MLVELGVAEQRYRAVLEVLDEGAMVTDVAHALLEEGEDCGHAAPVSLSQSSRQATG